MWLTAALASCALVCYCRVLWQRRIVRKRMAQRVLNCAMNEAARKLMDHPPLS